MDKRPIMKQNRFYMPFELANNLYYGMLVKRYSCQSSTCNLHDIKEVTNALVGFQTLLQLLGIENKVKC